MNNSRKKRYIFYTSCSQHVSTVIDEVTLGIILNTPGSFPAPATMACPLHRNRRNPPSHQQPIRQHQATTTRHRHSFNPAKGEVKGWTDSARSVTPPGEWTEQQMQIQPPSEKLDGSHHMVCVTEEKHGNKIYR